MEKTVKTVNELELELNELKKENAALKARYEKDIFEHKLTEEALKQSSQKWEAIVQTSPDGIGIVTLDGKIQLISGKLLKMHGYYTEHSDEFIGKSIFDFIDSSNHKMLVDNISKLLSGERDDKLTEYLGIRKDNSRFNIDVNSIALLDLNRSPASILYVERDITKRKLVEEALRESEEKYRLIFEYSPIGLLLFDEEGCIVACNDRIVQIIGSSREALIGLNMLQLPDKKLVSCVRKALDGTIGSYEDIYHSVTAQKNTPVRAIFTPIEIRDGYINGGVGIIEDITERKNAEEILQQSNQKLEAIISSSPDGIGMLTLDGKMQFMSDRLLEMYGFSAEDRDKLIGKPAFDFIDPSYQELLAENMRRLVAGESDHKIKDYLAIKKDNSRFYFEINYNLLHDSTGNPTNFLFVERDVTERKKTELIIQEQNKQLYELNAAKDRFFSIISHDLKSPFQSLISMTGLLAESIGVFSTAELSSFGKKMNDNAKNLLKLLSNLLEWARMQQGIVKFEPVEIVLSEIVSENIELIIRRGEQKGIELIAKVYKDHTIIADVEMLNSVLRNLLSNALKFTKQGGKITVSSKEIENNMMEISVADSGIGMSAQLCSRLFKIEEKVGRIGTDGEGSTGLGLLLCKEFIEKHGGKIWVESKENIGSIFYFTLKSATKVIVK
jgi:PAS domain S-box-containing protein